MREPMSALESVLALLASGFYGEQFLPSPAGYSKIPCLTLRRLMGVGPIVLREQLADAFFAGQIDLVDMPPAYDVIDAYSVSIKLIAPYGQIPANAL